MRRLASNCLSAMMGLLLLGAAPASIATRPISRLATPWWRQRFEAKQRELGKRVDLLWLGDSITQDWERTGPEPWRNFAPIWQRYYGDRNAVNLGFKGDSTCHLLWRLEHGELDGVHPRAVVLLIGANNFGHIHTDAAATFAGIGVILDLLHDRLPETRVLLIGVLPSIRSPWVTTNTLRLNRELSGFAAANRTWVSFVDAAPLFLQAGRVAPDRFMDSLLTPPDPPLHPTAQSQAALAALIEPTLASLLGDREHH
ncbi:GDSL-type esterase/lipase family protein [Lichenicoccus sp.]|uniref:GDSL-type esterase/lipase family protein n=1 Tax=Lichenicoccus sp. TaxID=2781899 RepID=UPI003D0D4E00